MTSIASLFLRRSIVATMLLLLLLLVLTTMMTSAAASAFVARVLPPPCRSSRASQCVSSATSQQSSSVILVGRHHSSLTTSSTSMAKTTTTSSSSLLFASSASVLTPLLHAALKKPSKTLAVCLEYNSPEEKDLSAVDLQTLSMQLRKLKAAAIATGNLQAVKEFSKEQVTAAGNFPGPCPVIYNGKQINKAIEAGASAVVMNPKDMEELSEESLLFNTEIIWRVESTKDVQQVLDSARGGAFLLDGEQQIDIIQNVIHTIPKDAVIMGSIDAMQDDNAELELSKKLQDMGCTCVFVRGAAVGDAEDLDYAAYCIDALTKKKSSQFNMTGLTGSVNGHFGGVASSGKVTWRRQKTK